MSECKRCEQYLKTCEDLTLENIRYRQRAKVAESDLNRQEGQLEALQCDNATKDEQIKELEAQLKQSQDLHIGLGQAYESRGEELNRSHMQCMDLGKQLKQHEEENSLLVFKVLQRDALLIANEIEPPDNKPATFLPDCKWQCEGHRNQTVCDNTDHELYGQPCSKRCACPEQKQDPEPKEVD